MKKWMLQAAVLVLGAGGCERVDLPGGMSGPAGAATAAPALDEVARLLSGLPIGEAQVVEVYDAVGASSENGYDEEYRMADLFACPGSGVGDEPVRSGGRSYDRPLRDLIRERVSAAVPTRSGGADAPSPEAYLEALESSDIQIYWPYSEAWDGRTFPVITWDPSDGSEANVGWRLVETGEGPAVEEVVVDEDFARTHPVWVVNRNDDADFLSLALRRRQDPLWGETGGVLETGRPEHHPTRSGGAPSVRSLVLKEFTATRNFDTWFAGASEFFVKCGAVEDFTASTEEEMLAYSPAVTDFMVVVRRGQVGEPVPFNAMLVSQWTEQLDRCAFLIVEDDGGTVTSWKCAAEVKVKSKTYGFDVTIPFHTRDDIVWRGQLSRPYFEGYSAVPGNFGDVTLTFELVSR